MHIKYERLMQHIKPTDRVLDLGGAVRVFPRANVVADLLPYEDRKIVMPDVPEHFGKDDWIIADFCAPSFWEKIPDKTFDFVTIGHTLEDIRDPLYVCSQMIRCSKAGYIEAPSKARELSKHTPDDIFSGHGHHRWVIEPTVDLSGLIFKAKLGWSHHGDYLGDERRHLLKDYFFGFDGYFWKDSFTYVEHFSKSAKLEIDDARFFFEHRVKPGAARHNLLHLKRGSSSPNDGRCLWINEYMLPSEVYKKSGMIPDAYKQYAA